MMSANKRQNLKKIITDSSYRFESFGSRGFYNHLSDEEYICRMFKAKMGYPLNLENPQTFNEKLQWLKLYDRKPIYTTMVDKYAAKEYVASIIGDEYIIPTLGIWDRFVDIDFNTLPNQFVLKCTHDSGGLVICKDKSKLDIAAARKKINKSLKTNYFYSGREWPYKDVKPRIIAEKYISDSMGSSTLTDYKFYCFRGVADCVLVCFGRETGNTRFYFFDKEWKLKRYNKQGKAAPEGFTVPKPECMDKMFQIAEMLAKDIPAVRVDLYQSCGHIYFGELTFYPASGFDPNRSPEADYYFGSLIDLSKIKRSE